MSNPPRDINRTVASDSSSLIHPHLTALKQSVLESYENLIFSAMNKQPYVLTFFYEMLAMFIFTFGFLSSSKLGGTSGQVSAFAMVALAVSARMSGANINPSITLSNYLRKENRYRAKLLAVYLVAQMAGAMLAMLLAEVINGTNIPAPIPYEETVKECFRVILAEIMGTFILVFSLLQISNPNTTFIDNELSGFIFIVAFIHIGRQFAPPGCIVNPALILCASIMAVLRESDYDGLKYCGLWIVGDLIGAVGATYFYDKFFEPNVEMIREHKRNAESTDIDEMLR